MLGFADGSVRVLVSKPSICGFGMNWQGCHQMAFCGLSYSYEQFYQAVRRCWRFGQESPVEVHVFSSLAESASVDAVVRKEDQAEQLKRGMVEAMAPGDGAPDKRGQRRSAARRGVRRRRGSRVADDARRLRRASGGAARRDVRAVGVLAALREPVHVQRLAVRHGQLPWRRGVLGPVLLPGS